MLLDHIYDSLVRAQMRAVKTPERAMKGSLRALVKGLSNETLLRLLDTPVRDDAYDSVAPGLGEMLFWAGDDLPMMIEAEAERRGLLQ